MTWSHLQMGFALLHFANQSFKNIILYISGVVYFVVVYYYLDDVMAELNEMSLANKSPVNMA